jgi:hypothetical protein
MVSVLLACAIIWLFLMAGWCLMGATPRGQPWTHALTLLHMRDGLRVLLMVVVCPFRRPSLCRPVHRQFMRNALLDLTTIVPTAACHQRDYVETCSRFIVSSSMTHYGSYDPATPCFGVPACEDPGRFGYF